MSLSRRAEQFCLRSGFPLRGKRVLCAVSGGIDSMVLLHLLWSWSRQGRIRLTAATFDHQLRACSGEDAAFVEQWCICHEIPCISGAGDVSAYARASGETLEEAARTLRYAFLERSADQVQADYIATAHNADDNAETLLLHLLRGSGLNGLGGIPPRRGRIIRPLLQISRAEIERYARGEGIPCREDESNADTAYTRNYLRHQVMPLLKEKNPQLVSSLSRTAESLRQDEEYLWEQTQQQAQKLVKGNAVSVRELSVLPDAIALRLVQKMAQGVKPGVVLPWQQRLALVQLAREGKPSDRLSLAEGLRAKRDYDILRLEAEEKREMTFAPFILRAGEKYSVQELGLTLSCARIRCPATEEQGKLRLKCGSSDSVTVRPRKTGDEIKLPNRGTKSLKKWMIEERIPRAERSMRPVFEIDGQVAAVWDMGRDARWIPAAGEPALEICFKRNREEKKP